MFLLDTCVLSEATKMQPSTDVDAWLKQRPTVELFISAVTLGELRYGIDRMPQGVRRARLEIWFDETAHRGFPDRIISFDKDIALLWGRLRSLHPGAAIADSQIAATAFFHGLTLVTRNVRDFSFAGLSLFNPWQR